MAKNTNTSANPAENKNVNTNTSANKEKMKVVAIPVDPLNVKDKTVKVTINGEEHKIKRGVQTKVTKQVYEMLVIAGYVIEGGE